MTGPVGGSGRRGIQSVTGRVAGARSEMDAGAEAFLKLSKRLKEAGGTGKGSIRSEMNAAIRKAAKPLPKAVKDEAGRRLPQRGGLAKAISKRTPKVTTRTGVKTAGVRIEDKTTDPRMSTQGRIYHPLFGRKGSDVVQIAPGIKGYFEDAIRDEAPEVRDAVIEVLEDYAARLLRGL